MTIKTKEVKNKVGIINLPKVSPPSPIIKYEDIINIENLKIGLALTKNNVAHGLDGGTKSAIDESRLAKLEKELRGQTYSPSPTKKVGIPKPDGGVRYLGIASQIDKVVQGAILTQLEPVLEQVFFDVSYGYRPRSSCHDALKDIKYKWKGIVWIINVDISTSFDKIQHERLLVLLAEYMDQAAVELVRKLLKAGYVNLTDTSDSNKEGTPQGSLISPILSNLYLHELDQYVLQELIPQYNIGDKRLKSEEDSKRYSKTEINKTILKEYTELKKSSNRVQHSRSSLDTFLAPADQKCNYRRLHYVRYVNDFLMGFIGPKKEADEISNLIRLKLNTLHFTSNQNQTKILHSSEMNIKYLGVYIRYVSPNKIAALSSNSSEMDEVISQENQLRSQAIATPHFRVPVEFKLKTLVSKGIATNSKGQTYRATAMKKWCVLEDQKIVGRFSLIIRGLENYYSCVNHRSDLWKIFAILRKSCALTLANKYQLNSAARAYCKFGPKLTITEEITRKKTSLYYPSSLKTDISFRIGGSGIKNPNIEKSIIDGIPGSSKTNFKIIS